MVNGFSDSRTHLLRLLRSEGLILLLLAFPTTFRAQNTQVTSSEFDSEAFAALPLEKPYAFQSTLESETQSVRRDPTATAAPEELAITQDGWTLLVRSDAAPPLRQAAQDLRDYLETAMRTPIALNARASVADWETLNRVIAAGTREQVPGCGSSLAGTKDYQIVVSRERIAVCGFDELGAMYGLYNLEERFDLREAPFLPRNLSTVRHSLYRARMTLSGLGWMEWPDRYLATLPRYGFDSIFASIYANPNGVAASPPYDKMRKQDPQRLHDLVHHAARYGIRLYCPILYYYTGEPENETGLRGLVRDIVREFPDIRGYVLLTEGFDAAGAAPWLSSPGASRPSNQNAVYEWIRRWTKAVGIAAEECHKRNPAIEVLAWDYNVDFRPDRTDLQRYAIDQLPERVIPLVTFENGKSFSFAGEESWVKDYSISQVGPAEAAVVQIAEAKKRRLPSVYAKADTWASWQFGTFPYLPFPYQWYARYQALEESGIDGVMESWTYGFKPNFVAEMRAWYSWSDAPPLDDLLRAIARRDFGKGSEDLVLKAWKHFSSAIRLDPDTGPLPGGNNAVAHPLFFQKPEPRAMTLEHSEWDQDAWYADTRITPYWPFVRILPSGWSYGFLLYPDFSNQINVADRYAKPLSLQVFSKYLLMTADEIEDGLKDYRRAALGAPDSKRTTAFREVLLTEQLERMIRSNHAVLEFEDLRFRLAKSTLPSEQQQIVDRMTTILMDDIVRTEAALETARRDSRLGYEWESDYVYSPATIEGKLQLLRQTLDDEIPTYKEHHGLR